MPRSGNGFSARALLMGLRALAVAGAMGAPGVAAAQCTPRWTAAPFNSGGFVGGAHDAVVFDDGGGPALYLAGGGSISGVVTSSGVLRYDGYAWSALPSNGCVQVGRLVVFDDDGAGPIPPAIYTTACFEDGVNTRSVAVTKWDGQAWHLVGEPLSVDIPNVPSIGDMIVHDDGTGPALYVIGYFTRSGDQALSHVAKWDGTRWTSVGPGLPTTGYCLGAFDEDGDGPQGPRLFAGGAYSGGIQRWDGVAWTTVGTGASGLVEAMTVFDADGPGPEAAQLYTAAEFYDQAAGESFVRLRRWNGASWLVAGPDVMDCPRPECYGPGVYDMSVIDLGEGPRLFMAGNFSLIGARPFNGIAMYDGVAWTDVQGGLTRAGGAGAGTFVRRFDIGNGPEVVVGGDFEAAGGVPARGLATYDGSTFRSFGTDNNTQGVRCLLPVYGKGTTETYAGGTFDFAGGVRANNIARWDGEEWHALGEGVTGCEGAGCVAMVRSIATLGGEIYATGVFTHADGAPAGNIARFDGAAWHAMGAGLDSMGFAVSAIDPDGVFGPQPTSIYAGGIFGSAGGVSTPGGIAKWDGTSWSALGTGIQSGFTTAVGFYNSSIYIGGHWTLTGGTRYAGVLRLNGNVWTSTGTSIQLGDEIRAMTTFGNMLYVGGRFSTIGSSSGQSRHIARWNGTSWSALQNGLSDSAGEGGVHTMVTYNSGSGLLLAVGGGLNNPASPSITFWTGSNWTNIGSGFPNNNVVRALAYEERNGAGSLLAAGIITGAGDGAAFGLASLTAGEPLVTVSPESRAVRAGETAVFNVAAGGPGPLTYQWRRDGAPLSDTGRITGTASRVLVIRDVGAADAGAYLCAVANGCGEVLSGEAELSLRCLGDWDGSGEVSSQDFFDFLTDFFAGTADFNGDGETNSQDFFEFIGAFFGVC